MKQIFLLTLIICVLQGCASEKRLKADYVKYVNPFIGTDFTGNTYPGAQVPFGMVQLSPDNGLPGWTVSQAIFIRTVPLPDSVIHTSPEPGPAIYMIFPLCR